MVTVNVLRGTGMTVAISVGLLVGFRIQYELIQARDVSRLGALLWPFSFPLTPCPIPHSHPTLAPHNTQRRISERVDREVERILEERRRSAAASSSAGALK
jgi:hypothetical protein